MHVQYGCGLSAPQKWVNFDVSPTLRLQNFPLLGIVLRPLLNVQFPNNVKYGDIIKGLPVKENSVDGIYCSHTLEHLALDDLRIALKNTHKVMKSGAIFRMVLPDLEFIARKYIENLDLGEPSSSHVFLDNSMLGIKSRSRGFLSFLRSYYGNSHHLWMWDFLSLSKELDNLGFENIRRCNYGDSKDEMFKDVEDIDRFHNCLSLECVKSDFKISTYG